jgi:hypothetical protein
VPRGEMPFFDSPAPKSRRTSDDIPDQLVQYKSLLQEVVAVLQPRLKGVGANIKPCVSCR